MALQTPGLQSQHEQLPAQSSRYIDVPSLPWQAPVVRVSPPPFPPSSSGQKKAGLPQYRSDISATRLSLRDPIGFPPHPRGWLSSIVYRCSVYGYG